MKVFRASDNMLIYEVTYDDYMNDLYDIEGTVSGDTEVRNGTTLVLDPFNAHTLLDPGTEYYITVDEGFIRFEDGTVNPAIENGEWAFTTMEESSPAIAKEGTFRFSSGITGSTSARYTYSYDESWFFEDSYTYNHELARMSLCAAMSAFDIGGNDRAANIKDLMDDLGFTYTQESVHYPTPTSDSIGYAIGSKNIRSTSGETTTVLLVAIRGGGYGAEWASNFTLGISSSHQGFSEAAEQVVEGIEDYLASNPHNKNIKLWITGYSRAAATANVAASLLDSSANRGEIPGLDPNDIFAYCFECPRTASYGTQYELYDNIFSIINYIDIVTKVAPSDWGYGRYGITYVLPVVVKATANNATQREMRQEYEKIYQSIGGNTMFDPSVEELTDQIYGQGYWTDKMVSLVAAVFGDAFTYAVGWEDFIRSGVEIATDDSNVFLEFLGMFGDVKTVVDFARHPIKTTVTTAISFLAKEELLNLGYAHYPELCLAWMNSLSGEEAYQRPGYRVLFVNCPVDVTVRSAGGEALLSIKDRTVFDSVDETIGAYIDENGQMIILLPSDDSYEVEMKAMDEGTVTYTVSEINLSVSQVERVVSYHNIPITSGDVLSGTVEDLEETSNAQYALVMNGGEKIEPTVDQQGSAVEKYAIAVETSGNGTATGSGYYLSGEHVQLIAMPEEGESFLGWYSGGTLLSQDMEYRMLIDCDMTIMAMFTGEGEAPDIPEKPDGPSQPDCPSGGGSSSSDSGDYLISVDRVSGGRVTVQPSRADKGDTVTITVYPNDGYELDELVVTDSRGNEIDLDARSATRFTFTMPGGKVTVEASFVREGGQTQPPQTTFADVPASAWYYDAVEYVYENGLMSGVSGGRFAPNDTLTRAMLVQTLYAMEGRPAAASAGFADVASGDWYASAVNWAAANGVVSGVSETGFGPNNALTREQLALILYRFAQYKGYDVIGTSDLAAYADGSSVSGWAAEAMGWAVDAGLISGVGGNQIAPTGTASRAQVAQILMNFCENVAR